MSNFWYGVRLPNNSWTRPDFIEFQNWLALNPVTEQDFLMRQRTDNPLIKNSFYTPSPFGTSSFSVTPDGIYHYEAFRPTFNRYFLKTPNGYGQGVEISSARRLTYQPVINWNIPPNQLDPFYMNDTEFDEWLALHPPPPDPVNF